MKFKQNRDRGYLKAIALVIFATILSISSAASAVNRDVFLLVLVQTVSSHGKIGQPKGTRGESVPILSKGPVTVIVLFLVVIP